MGGAPGNKLYWYGSGGEILSETDASGNTLNEYIFFGGKRVAQVPASGGPLYYAEDMLGSSRVMVQSNGTLCFDADFTPFGGERDYTTTCATAYKFEGKERDAETQNDNFGAREYSWRFGRWLSADWSATPVAVPYANLANPQTLNLYSMVADDPESFADLDGHTPYGGDGIRLGCDPGQVMCTTDIGEGRLVVRGPGDMDSATDDAKMEVVESNPDSVGQANGAAFAAWAGETGNSGGPAQNLIPASVLQRMQEDLHSGKFGQFGDPSQGTLNINFDSLLKKASDFSAGAGDCLTGRCIPFVHTSLTEKARGLNGADSVVDKKSLSYTGGEITGGAVGSALLSAGGATVAAIADGKNGALFGRGVSTVFNSSKVRFGWGWQGSATAGRDVIRLGIGAARGTSWWSHIVFWVP